MIHLALTFDIEQWDEESCERAYIALIGALGDVRTTWFVTEDNNQSTIAKYPRVLERAMLAGHEIGAHVHFDSSEQTRILNTVRRATERLRALGSSCVSFRGGAHVFDDAIANELVRLGYKWDSSAVPGLVREYRTSSGTTVANYAHVFDCRPFWWCPGLLELPLASFPVTRPYAFFKRRLRLPLLLSNPGEYVRRLGLLEKTRSHEDLPLVALGHSFELKSDEAVRQLREGIEVLRRRGVRFSTIDAMAKRIVSGDLVCSIRTQPRPIAKEFGRAVSAAFLGLKRRTGRFSR